MKLVLRGFSQDVDLANPENAENYIVLEDELSGTTVRLPVAEATISAIVKLIQAAPEEDEGITNSELHKIYDTELEEEKPEPKKGKLMSEDEVGSL